MNRCRNCGILLDNGDWWVEKHLINGDVDILITCSDCHNMDEISEQTYKNSCFDIEERKEET